MLSIVNIEEFKRETECLFPVKRENIDGDFRIDLKTILDKYEDIVRKLDKDLRNHITDDWNGLQKRIGQLNAGIIKYVRTHFEAAHFTAFMTLYNQLHGLKKLSAIHSMIGAHEIPAGEYLWRGRAFEDNREVNKDDMFHIPFNKRGFVKTQRYSVHGFPCLYLGTTINSCWEELGRPKFDDLMFSGFRVKKNIKLLDMRRPQDVDFEEQNLKALLLRLPLILACSFVVQKKDEKADFKPEYIIPQMLLADIIHTNSGAKNRQKEEILNNPLLGIIYTSTKFNSDFNRTANYFESIAIPAIDLSNSTGHCPKLKQLFEVTHPTCNEYEGLKEDVVTTYVGYSEEEDPCDPVVRYKRSKMGVLEDRIRNRDQQQLKTLENVRS